MTTQLATARAQKADLESRSKIIRSILKSGKPVETNDIVNSDLLKRLVEQRVLLRSQLAEQSSTLLDRHPRIQELSAQINALDEQMRGELVRLVNSIENDARIAEARVDATNDSLDRLKKQIGGASAQDVQLRALEREAKAQRDLLESYLARYREAAARENINSSLAEARVISRATHLECAGLSEEGADPADRGARHRLPDVSLRAVVGDCSSRAVRAPPRSPRNSRWRGSRAAAGRGRASGPPLDLLGAEAKAEASACGRTATRRAGNRRGSGRTGSADGRDCTAGRREGCFKARVRSRPRSATLQ